MEQERSRYELLVSTLRAQIEAIQNTMHGTREQMEQQITELSLDRSQLDFQVKELTRQMDTLQSDRSRMTEGDPPLSYSDTLSHPAILTQPVLC